MTWFQVLAVLGCLGTYIFMLFQKLDQDIRYLQTRMDETNSRIDGILSHMLRKKDE